MSILAGTGLSGNRQEASCMMGAARIYAGDGARDAGEPQWRVARLAAGGVERQLRDFAAVAAGCRESAAGVDAGDQSHLERHTLPDSSRCDHFADATRRSEERRVGEES